MSLSLCCVSEGWMLEQGSLEASGTQGEGRAATAAQVSGWGCQTGAPGKRRRHSCPLGLAVCAMWGQPPIPTALGLLQWPKEMETPVEEGLMVLQG